MAWPGCNLYKSLYGTRAAVEGDRRNGVLGIAHAQEEGGLPGEIEPLELVGLELDAEVAKRTGHGGGTYHNCRDFVDAILDDRLPFINV